MYVCVLVSIHQILANVELVNEFRESLPDSYRWAAPQPEETAALLLLPAAVLPVALTLVPPCRS